MTRYTIQEAELRARAAEYAAALLVERPDLCRDELDALVQAMDAATRWANAGGDVFQPLVARIDTILQRDDEDTDETARLIFEALAQ